LREAIVVRAKLVKIGHSRGIRLAKPLLEVAGLADEVEIEAAPWCADNQTIAAPKGRLGRSGSRLRRGGSSR